MLDLYYSEREINIKVLAPEGVDSLYITGNIPELGNWDPAGILMKKNKDFFEYTFKVSRPQKIEYKYTCGTWLNVERCKDGSEMKNREIFVDSNTSIKDTISNIPCKNTLTGNFEYIDIFDYKAIVYLPPDYYSKNKKYPVLYMQDGQNLFDENTSFLGIEWNADEWAEKLIKENIISPMIIVGIYNRGDKRVDDYTPFYEKSRKRGGKAHEYLNFLCKELIPFLDSNFRTIKNRENRIIGGSSLGGLFSLWAGYEREDIFSGVVCMSPALWWDNKHIIKYIKDHKDLNVWLDIGTEEGNIINKENPPCSECRELYNKLDSMKYKIKYKEYKGAIHHEKDWAVRFGDILKYFYLIGLSE